MCLNGVDMRKIRTLDDRNPSSDVPPELGALRARERILVSIALVLVLIIALIDMFEDTGQRQSVARLIADLSYLGVMVALLAYLWRSVPSTTRKQNLVLTREVVEKHRDLERWRQRATGLIAGLREMMDQQFDDWKLSAAERQVAVLLIKGLSLKEIAVIRTTSERTVRQQAGAVYAKSGLGGRAELSAFFLEDLLPPEAERR